MAYTFGNNFAAARLVGEILDSDVTIHKAYCQNYFYLNKIKIT